MNDGGVRVLSLTVEAHMLPVFFPLMQDGFFLEAQVTCTIRDFLRDRCSLTSQIIEKRISTVFLDGKPVDDLDRAIVKHDSRLALSGAMPGLVGAVMRSNSPLKSFRSSITHRGDEETTQQTRGLVHVKLFNTVMSELAARFLREGILLEPFAVQSLLVSQPADARSGIREIQMNNQPVTSSLLLDGDFLSGPGLVSFTVSTHE